MTPKEGNELKFVTLIFGPMIGIPLLIVLFGGSLNIGTGFLGVFIGIICAKIALITGFVKNEV